MVSLYHNMYGNTGRRGEDIAIWWSFNILDKMRASILMQY